eukprot:3345021-Pleurochrysis_carterae.AAC.4
MGSARVGSAATSSAATTASASALERIDPSSSRSSRTMAGGAASCGAWRSRTDKQAPATGKDVCVRAGVCRQRKNRRSSARVQA